MRIMCFTDHDKSWLKYERVSLSNWSFPQWGYIYSSVSGLGLQGPFSLEETENICIYCMSSIQALYKKYGKCLPEEISQSLKNFPSIIPHTFLSASFLPPTTHHLSKENHARLFNGLVIIRSCYGTLVCWEMGFVWFVVKSATWFSIPSAGISTGVTEEIQNWGRNLDLKRSLAAQYSSLETRNNHPILLSLLTLES